jgi:O-antigen ligase
LLEKRAPIIGLLGGLIFLSASGAKKWIFALLALAVVAVIIIDSSLFFRFTSELRSELRPLIWKAGIEVFLNHPFGLGYGGSLIIRELNYPELIQYKHFHSAFLTILIENGILNFAIFLIFLFQLFRASNNLLFRGLLTCFLLTGIFESNISDTEVLVCLLILSSLARIKRFVPK